MNTSPEVLANYTSDDAGKRVGRLALRPEQPFGAPEVTSYGFSIITATVGQGGAQDTRVSVPFHDGRVGESYQSAGFLDIAGFSASIYRGESAQVASLRDFGQSFVAGDRNQTIAFQTPTSHVSNNPRRTEVTWIDDVAEVPKRLRLLFENIGALGVYGSIYYFYNFNVCHIAGSHPDINLHGEPRDLLIPDPAMHDDTLMQLQSSGKIMDCLDTMSNVQSEIRHEILGQQRPDDILSPEIRYWLIQAREILHKRELFISYYSQDLILPWAMVAGRRKAELYGDFIDVSPEIDRQLSDSARITVSDISGLLEQEATAHKERKAKQLAAKNALEWLAGAELALACQEAK